MLPKQYPVTCHTNHVGPGSTFVAVKGFTHDGSYFILRAIKLGAKKIAIEKNCKLNSKILEQQKNGISFCFVKNARKALAQLCTKALDYPAKKLKIIGITGTKGKTSTCYLIKHILQKAGYKTALIGTIKNKILDKEISTQNTTPESDYIQMFLAECVKQGVEYVVIEVSSHALSLYRTYGIKFNTIGFTNLAPEHLDFYKTMQNYFAAKLQIFKQLKKGGCVVINTKNMWGKKAAGLLKIKTVPFIFCGIKTSKLPGEFNSYNITMAFLICKNLGINPVVIKEAIKIFPGIPGRLQMHTLKNGTRAFVDFAHNPSSMEAVLKTLKPLTKDLIIVFGCGGDRDKTKRPKMGKIATVYGDKIILTNDNPRFEKSKDIVKDIFKGITKKELHKFQCEFNRKKAIQKAAKLATKDSVIAILGKGHENYYLVKGKKYHLNDFEEISKY